MPLHLRLTTPDDLPFVLAAEHDPEHALFIGQWTHARHLAALEDVDIAHLILARGEDEQRVGYAIITGLTDRDRGVRLRRICVTEKGRGYGREAMRLLKQMVFEEMGARRLWLMVRSHNVRAQHLYESAGLRREAAEPGTQADAPIIMSMLGPDRG